MASLPTSKKPPIFIGMEKPLQGRKFKSAKLETSYIVFTFVAWTVSYKAESSSKSSEAYSHLS